MSEKKSEKKKEEKKPEESDKPKAPPVIEVQPEVSVSSLPVEVYKAMEKKDEEAILDELKGELLDNFVYTITVWDRKTGMSRNVTSLSYAGVKEAIRWYRNIEIIEHKETITEEEYLAVVRVKDLKRNIEVLGASSCKKDVPFAWVLAVNKAERNAFRKLLPEELMAQVIKHYKEKYGAKTMVVEVPEGPSPPIVSTPRPTVSPGTPPTTPTAVRAKSWFTPPKKEVQKT